MNNNDNFRELILLLDHGIRKLPNRDIAGRLVVKLEHFERFCNSVGRSDTSQMLNQLISAFLCHSIININFIFNRLQQHVEDTGIGSIEPNYLNHEIWVYRNNQIKLGLFFSVANHVVKRAVGSLLRFQFGLKRPIEVNYVKNMTTNIITICDSRSYSILQAAKVPHKKCIVMDSYIPEMINNDIFIRLPITKDGFELFSDSLTVK